MPEGWVEREFVRVSREHFVLWTCRRCGALVDYRQLGLHRRSHGWRAEFWVRMVGATIGASVGMWIVLRLAGWR